MLYAFFEKILCGRYVRQRAKNTLVLYQHMKSPYISDEEVFEILIASSFEMLIGEGFIDTHKQQTDTYVKRLISDTKKLCQDHNKPFCLQAVAIQIIGTEVAFMADGKRWCTPDFIGTVVPRNVSIIISASNKEIFI